MGSGKPRATRRQSPKSSTQEECFLPLTQGEKASATRLLLEDPRLASMAKVGRYQVISAEPWIKKSKQKKGSRSAKILVFNYASNKTLHAFIDLQEGKIVKLVQDGSQPMLSPEEECRATKIALLDQRVSTEISGNQKPLAVLQYWSSKESDLSYNQRSAALVFGDKGPTLVAIVNLNSASVIDVVPNHKW